MAPGGGSKRKKKLVRTRRVSKTDTTSDGEQQHASSLSEGQGQTQEQHGDEDHQQQSLARALSSKEHPLSGVEVAEDPHGTEPPKDEVSTVPVDDARPQRTADEVAPDDTSECSGNNSEGQSVQLQSLNGPYSPSSHGPTRHYSRARYFIRKDTVIRAVPRAQEEEDLSVHETDSLHDEFSDRSPSLPDSPSPVQSPAETVTDINGLRDSEASNPAFTGPPASRIASSCLQALPWRKGVTPADQMGDQSPTQQQHSNPKWQRAAVRAVQLQDHKRPPDAAHISTKAHVANHPRHKAQTGNGGIVNSGLPHGIPPPPPVPHTIPHVPPPPPPPGPWSECGVVGLESYPPNRTSGGHTSVLVDMGKVVGVLRSQGPKMRPPQEHSLDEEEEDEEAIAEHNPAEPSSKAMERTCASCSGVTNHPDTLDDSLCGDPLMYATFVAPVQQYSTDTEPSRQPSFNYPSRQPSFKQNSSENEASNQQQADQNYAPFPRLPPQIHQGGHNFSDEVQDIYEKVPIEQWPLPPIPQGNHHDSNADDCVEISQEELDHQVAQERLSFISGSSNNEDDDEEEEDESSPGLPPLPMAPKAISPPLTPYALAQDASLDQWGSGEDSETHLNTAGTVRRKVKRDRNKTLTSEPTESCCRHGRSKSRSKSRSPGRTIDSSTAIVIVHHRRHVPSGKGWGSSSSRVSGSRGTSPDNISESSVSFHENELTHGKGETSHPQSYHKSRHNVPYPTPPVTFPRSPEAPHFHHPHDGSKGSQLSMFANQDSARESWVSSGSDKPSHPHRVQQAPPSSAVRPSSDHRQMPQYNLPMRHVMATPTPSSHQPPTHGSSYSAAECSVPTTPFMGYRPTALPTSRLTGGSLPRRRTTPPPTTVGTGSKPILRSSSRESGSSWSVHRSTTQLARGSTTSLHPKHSHSGTPEDERISRESSSTTSISGATGTPPTPPAPCLSSYQSASLRVGLPDCVHLEDDSPQGVVNNLHLRYRKDHIYTNIGSTLVSINPYKKIHLYTPDVIDVYRCHCLFELPPHIYSVADRAWRHLRDMNCDQSIVISGESGSGKTETAKLTLHYLAAVTSHDKEFHSLKYQLLQSNPVLEAFGNAKTKHNDNSSRFGKYMEISFDFKGDPIGGLTSTYLLEKSRVVGSTLCEGRNFHIMYQTVQGADVSLLKELRLHRNLDSYRILHLGTAPRTDQNGSASVIDDRKDFLITKRAMEDVGMTSDEILLVMRIVASILKLGNLHFIPTSNMDGTEGCGISNDYELYETCEVLCGDYGTLHSALVTRSIESRSEYLITDLSAKEAGLERDSLCRVLYGRLFTWLVNRINEGTRVKAPRKHCVMGILDLYGFECNDQSNGFEQLVINYANESLQQMITQTTLVADQAEYMTEGIEWRDVEFFDNSVICDLIGRSHSGVLSILDEVTLKRSANLGALEMTASIDGDAPTSGAIFVEQLRQTLKEGHPYLELPTQIGASDFQIKHFAGVVSYSAEDFVSRNQDALDRDLSHAMFTCDHPLLKVLFPEGNPRRTTRRRPATAGTQFKISIGALVNNLAGKSPHFVRCIKPNKRKQPRNFDDELVTEQVGNHGLLATLRLRKQGFAFRLEYNQFLTRYKMLSQHTWPHWRGPSVEGVTYLLRELPINANEYAFGRTKIFIRSAKTAEMLEEFRREKIDDLATLIQKTYRGHSHRRKWDQLKNSQVIISNYWKRWKNHANIVELKQRRKEEWAALVIQNFLRSLLRQKFLFRLSQTLPSESPLAKDWPSGPRYMRESNILLRRLFHKWRGHRYRLRFDQVARNRMREKVTASIIFKDRKASYPRSIYNPFLGDYVRLRQNPQWKKMSTQTNDQYVVFADIINKITRSSGKFVPILFVISTSSMLIMDQRTMQIKYRIPAAEIYKLSLSPYFDDIAVFHVRASSPTRELKSQANIPGCLSSENIKKKGDFVLQSGHVIEIVTKMFLVVQNATGKPPNVNISTNIDANFGNDPVPFTFKRTSGGTSQPNPGHVKLVKRGNRFEIFV